MLGSPAFFEEGDGARSAWVGAALSASADAASRSEARRKAAASLEAREFAARVEWLAADL